MIVCFEAWLEVSDNSYDVSGNNTVVVVVDNNNCILLFLFADVREKHEK